MAETTFDLLTRTSVKPVYDTVDLGGFNPEMAGKLVRVRVNLSKRMRRELDAIPKAGDPDTRTEDEKKEATEKSLAFTRLLVPRDLTGDAPLTPEEWDAFLNATDENGDDSFQGWLIGQVWGKLNDHFLALSPQTSK